MNKKKVASLLLVGSLLVGGGLLGAKAWFTDTANVKSDLVITTGKLDVEVTNDNVWHVENKTNNNTDLITEVSNKEEANNFENARPGDSFIKSVDITNRGTLKQRLTITPNNVLPEEITKVFDVEILEMNGDEAIKDSTFTHVLSPNTGVRYTIKLTLKGPETDNTSQESTINFAKLNSQPFLTINATQVNNKQ